MDHCPFSENCNANAVVLLDEVEYKVLHCNLEHTHPDETFERLRDAFKSIEIAAQTGKKAKTKEEQLVYFNWINLILNDLDPS